jgi:CheY-like chemotaxis protein
MKQELRFNHPRVLVVEDNAMVRQVSVALLDLLNCDTLEAAAGKEALDVLEQDPTVDLLFTDIVMPGEMNGFRLAEQAREKHPGLKVLFTSGYTRDALPLADTSTPDSLVLTKPFGVTQLFEALKRLLPDSVQASN